jgi:hypothetical protein
VAGIIEQRDVRALNLTPEILDVGVEGGFVEVELGASESWALARRMARILRMGA